MANDNLGAFIPTTQVWSVSEIDTQSQAFKELFVRLHQNINSIAMLLNLKDTGQYSPQEMVCGQQYKFGDKPKQVFRKVINFGALPNTASKTSAHGISITTDYIFTRIYGVASDTTSKNYIPLPYASVTDADNVELKVDGTNITITTGKDRTAFDTTYVILEFCKF